ncbi:MAG: hypothetical protein AAFP70_03575 [Calditrichota bacterium]
MEEKQLVQEIQRFFGKDRKPFISFLKKSPPLDEAARQIRRKLKGIRRPLKVESLLSESAWTAIDRRKFSKLDTLYIGRPAWKVTMLLNSGVDKGYDWKRKLSKKCGGTARLLIIWMNEALSLYAMDSVYIQHHPRKNSFEIGPLDHFSKEDEVTVQQLAATLASEEWVFIRQGIAEKVEQSFISPSYPEGNAKLFNAVFGEGEEYQNGFHRFSDKNLNDLSGRAVSWHEYYTIDGILIERKEYTYFGAESILITTTDSMDRVKRVEVHREHADNTMQTFTMEIPHARRKTPGAKHVK